MRKYLLCLILSAILLSAGIFAGAVDNASILTAEELLQMVPAEVRQQAQAGKASFEQSVSENGFAVQLHQNNGACYIVSVMPEKTYHTSYGVFDFDAEEWRIPCTYDAVFRIPGGRYFLVEDAYFGQAIGDVETSVCYEAAADGTINPTPLPIQRKVLSVDEEGYVTLVRYKTVRTSNQDYADIESGIYAEMALLDNRYQIVLDYVAEDHWGKAISFLNDVAVIQGGSTKQEYAGHQQISLTGSKYGMINRKGEWIGRHNYTNMYRFDYKANARIFADRGEASYWIIEDGTEIPLPQKASELEEQYSDWAYTAIEQAKSRNLIPSKIEGYYTLDIFREEFCSLLMNVYRALGKEAPALDNTPTFTDCDLEDVRVIAALKVVSGYDDGSFRPRNRITREEAASILSRFVSLFQELDGTAVIPYQDDSEIGDWAKPQVYIVQSAGIMSGVSNGMFAPKNTYTIEQAISVANRVYDYLNGN